MKAITTKYIPPTNYRGARIKATDGHNSVTVPYEYGEGSEEMIHAMAAVALIDKMVKARHWRKPVAIASGGTDKGYVHVMLHDRTLSHDESVRFIQ